MTTEINIKKDMN